MSVGAIAVLGATVAVVLLGMRLVDRFATGGVPPAAGPLAWLAAAGFGLGGLGFIGLVGWALARYGRGSGGSAPPAERDIPTVFAVAPTVAFLLGGAAWLVAMGLTHRRRRGD